MTLEEKIQLIERVEEKIQLIERVLEFYASEDSYRGPIYTTAGQPDASLDNFCLVMQDRGQRARTLIDTLHREIDREIDSHISRESSTSN